FNGDAKNRRIFGHANERFELTEPCRWRSRGDGVPGDVFVECTIRYTNDWNVPAGVFPETEVSVFTVATDGTIRAQIEVDERGNSVSRADDWAEELIEYNASFWTWLGDAYPDVHEAINTGNDNIPGWIGDPSDMAIAVEYVPEFIAQSDVYPLTTP
ncbi:MAG: hypothetical protein ACR2P0_20400, partial [Acidimicrobiales bacterium]